ncbi:hypothetical protein H9Q08_17315 [Chryseobacterium sp. PS-8]|uniref:SMP domain-containing protein n=1 Tax=Chryseobacterium indicum TaxID=2766954 RepID=A0ABS9C9Q6_9FLAO|nr:hypothetical protein [Chryseobacterium sp. PS-8]MCF2221048.1 hypothetical protein [Chryseobacterium sp. PS-8]
MTKKPMTAADVARIQRATAKANGGIIPKGSFAARAQRILAKKPITAADVARIKSATAKANGGIIPKGSFAARAESELAKKAKK